MVCLFRRTPHAIVAQLQLGEMREQTAQLYRQSEVENAGASHRAAEVFRQLTIAQEQAKAASAQADAAAKTAKAAQDNVVAVRNGIEESSNRSKEALDATIGNFRQEQRAWIGISIPRFSIADQKDGDVIHAPIIISNTGRTPARKIEISANVTILKKGTDALILNSEGRPKHGVLLRFGSVQPNEIIGDFSIPAIDTFKGTIGSVKMTPEIRAGIPDGSYTFVIHGRLTYFDYFGKEHWVRFCHYANGLFGGTEECFSYNDFDKN
jgi:hypothetical protein